MSELPAPRYSIWQAINAALSLSMRAIEEVRALAARPPVPGPAGKDGMGFDDFTEEVAEDGRTIIHRYVRGDKTREFRHKFNFVLDRGIYRDGVTYEKGDLVISGGSGWIAQSQTQEKPGTGSKDWRLFAQKGRDGKDAVIRGPQGPVKLG